LNTVGVRAACGVMDWGFKSNRCIGHPSYASTRRRPPAASVFRLDLNQPQPSTHHKHRQGGRRPRIVGSGCISASQTTTRAQQPPSHHTSTIIAHPQPTHPKPWQTAAAPRSVAS
jgi:hypothetical protein